MVKKSHAEDLVGPWAKEKLANLEDYLRYYCTALSKRELTLVYVDGFAGAPVTTVRQSAVAAAQSPSLWGFEDDEDREQFVLGSPVRALSLTPGFDKHYFFDLDTRRAASLEELKSVYPEKSIRVIVGDANQKVKALVEKVRGRRNVKGVAFLDPYGPNLEWQTVAALASSRQFEVIINLPVHMAINRLLVKGAERNADWEAMIDRCFGTTAWRDFVYPKVMDLFGDTTQAKADGVPEKLKDLYMARLKEIFAETVPAKLIRNTKGSPLYYLIWAGPHKQGRIGAEYVLGNKKLLAKKNRA